MKGDSRHYVAAAWSRSQASFLVGVALVPALITELVRGLEERYAWHTLAGILLLVIVVTFGYAIVRSRRQGEPLVADDYDGTGIHLDSVEVLAATVDMTKPDDYTKSLHLLIRHLPRLREVHLVMGPCSPADERAAAAAFGKWLTETGRTAVAVGATCSIDAFSLTSAGAAALDALTTKLPADAVVDVTGGTVAMSLATYGAARARGLTVTYTEATKDAPGKFLRLTDISGPLPAAVPSSVQLAQA